MEYKALKFKYIRVPCKLVMIPISRDCIYQVIDSVLTELIITYVQYTYWSINECSTFG